MIRRSVVLAATAVLLVLLLAMPAGATTDADADAEAAVLGDLTGLLDLGDLSDLSGLLELGDLGSVLDLEDLEGMTQLDGFADLIDLDLEQLLGGLGELDDLSGLVNLGLGHLDALGLADIGGILNALPQLGTIGTLPALPLEDCLADLEGLTGDVTDTVAIGLGLDFLGCVLGALPDVVDSAHVAAIIAIVTDGIATGFEDGTFGPNLGMTRGQMATFLVRALNLSPAFGTLFGDVTDNPHGTAVYSVVKAGIAEGFTDGTFRPNDLVTRGQMATFLARAFGLVDGSTGGLLDVLGTTHAPSIGAVVDAGIAQGFTDGTFRPGSQVTRGQMATFLARALEG